jgi:hypothetical protein
MRGRGADFNNLLTTIRSGEMCSSTWCRTTGGGVLDRQAADRGALLTRQLLSFGRPATRAVASATWCAASSRSCSPLVRADVGSISGSPPGSASAVDPPRWSVVVNLILARDAVPAGAGTIETSSAGSAGSAAAALARDATSCDGGRLGTGLEDTDRRPASRPAAKPFANRAGDRVCSVSYDSRGSVRVSRRAGTLVKICRASRLTEPPDRARRTLGAPRVGTVLVAEDETACELLPGLTEFGCGALASF